MPLFSDLQKQEIADYLKTLEEAANREIQLAPERRSEIINYYQRKAEQYIQKKKTKNYEAFSTGSLVVTVIGIVCLIASIAVAKHFLLFAIGLAFSLGGVANWLLAKNRV